MSYWNYRVLIHDEEGEDYFAVHEVFYEDDQPDGWTTDPIDFGGDSVDAVRRALATAMSDSFRFPPLRINGEDLIEDQPRGEK